MREEGTIVGITDGIAQVGMADPQTCHRCGACARIGERMVLEVPLQPGSHLSLGDRVLVDIPAEASFSSAALVYVVPLAGLLLGAGLGSLLTRYWSALADLPNLAPIVLSLVGLAGGFTVTWLSERRRRARTHESIRIVQRL